MQAPRPLLPPHANPSSAPLLLPFPSIASSCPPPPTPHPTPSPPARHVATRRVWQALLDGLLEERHMDLEMRKWLVEQLTAIRSKLDYRGSKAIVEVSDELKKVLQPCV
ncbi:hypothetical protein AB1Y20_016667 [Prymnesium parvum]